MPQGLPLRSAPRLAGADDERVDEQGEFVDEAEVEQDAQQPPAGVDADDLRTAVAESIECFHQVDPVVAGDEFGDRAVRGARRRLVGVQGKYVGPIAQLSQWLPRAHPRAAVHDGEQRAGRPWSRVRSGPYGDLLRQDR